MKMNLTVVAQSLCTLGIISGPEGPQITRVLITTVRTSSEIWLKDHKVFEIFRIFVLLPLTLYLPLRVLCESPDWVSLQYTVKHTNICYTELAEKWYISEWWVPEYQLRWAGSQKIGPWCLPPPGLSGVSNTHPPPTSGNASSTWLALVLEP